MRRPAPRTRMARKPAKAAMRSWVWRIVAAGFATAVAAGLAGIVSVAVYAMVPPPATPLMWQRGIREGAWPEARRWRPLAEISRHLQRAVIAAEDQRFCSHAGFDWVELGKVWRRWREGAETRGASTISNQLAKNLFLWNGRSAIRKGLEAGFTVLIETLWSKQRILEVYLNVVEMGDGLYGAEAAAQIHFQRHAAELSPLQGALIAAALPNPRVRGDAITAPYMRQRAALVQQRAAQMGFGESKVCRE